MGLAITGVYAALRKERNRIATAGYVLGMLTLVAPLALPFTSREVRRRDYQSRCDTTGLTLNVLGDALTSFKTDTGRYPTMAEGLEALVHAPPGLAGRWKGPYVKAVPLDAWGNAFFYRMPGVAVPTEYELISAGGDGKVGTDDDLDRDHF